MLLRRPVFNPTSIPIRERDGGYVAEGPAFYIWDENPSEVLRVARALGHGKFDVSPSTRFLVIRDALDGVATR